MALGKLAEFPVVFGYRSVIVSCLAGHSSPCSFNLMLVLFQTAPDLFLNHRANLEIHPVFYGRPLRASLPFGGKKGQSEPVPVLFHRSLRALRLNCGFVGLILARS
jgi:hypothetical protein